MNVGYATNPTDDSQSRGMTGFGATLPLVHEQQRTAVHVRSGHRSGPAATELLSGSHYRAIAGQLRVLARRCCFQNCAASWWHCDHLCEGFVLIRNSRPQNCSAVAQALRATVDGGSLVGSPDLLPNRNLSLIGIPIVAGHVSAEMII